MKQKRESKMKMKQKRESIMNYFAYKMKLKPKLLWMCHLMTSFHFK